MTAQPAKFNFDLDMGQTEKPARMMNEAQIETIRADTRAEAYAQGFAEGEKSAVAKAAAALTAAGERMAKDAVQILSGIDTISASLRGEAAIVARAIGSKLATNLVARQPEAELERLIAECLTSIERAPHLVVRCHEALADRMREITEAHMAANGYAGKLIVIGDETIGVGDGRLEWADGGLVRSMSTIQSEIDARLAAYFEASGATPPMETDQ